MQAVALSPDYASDRMFVSGGLAGRLILTIGGKPGVRADANTNSAAAAASGWLGSVVGSQNGTDRELHAGEGAIHAIAWSHSGKYVAWVNETGIKIMRSSLHLERSDSDLAWERIAHLDPPQRKAWEGMTGVWKPRLQWIDDRYLEREDQEPPMPATSTRSPLQRPGTSSSASTTQIPKRSEPSRNIVEQLLVGWGDTIWIIDIRPGVTGAIGPGSRQKSLGRVDPRHHLYISDGLVSGVTLLTSRYLLAAIYRTKDDEADEEPEQRKPRRGIKRRQNALPPDLRIMDIGNRTIQEVDIESLSSIQKFQSLSHADYFLSTLYIPPLQVPAAAQKGALSALGGGLWDVSLDAGIRAVNAGRQATRLLGSGASMLSRTSTGDDRSSMTANSDQTVAIAPKIKVANPMLATSGLKVFFHSPYDCLLAVKREQSDHLSWLLETKDYAKAWRLLEAHPEVATPIEGDDDSHPSTPSKTSLAEFLEDSSSSNTTLAGNRSHHVAAEREKERIGDLWVRQLIASEQWQAAAETAGMVLGSSKKWEHWIWVFAEARRFDEITPYIQEAKSKLPPSVYEVVLAHYLHEDLSRFEQLIEAWDPTLYDRASIIKAIRAKLDSTNATQDRSEWQRLLSDLAKLYVEDQEPGEALLCYLRAKNASGTLDLVRRYQLLSNVSDKIWSFVTVGIPEQDLSSASAPRATLSESSEESIRLLASGALQDLISVDTVVKQLEPLEPMSSPFLFSYFRALWNGDVATRHDTDDALPTKTLASRKARFGRRDLAHTTAVSTKGMLIPYATKAVSLFAEYSRPLLTDLIKSSDDSGLPLTDVPGFYEHASAECEQRGYTHELVHLLSATGQTRRALHLIIDDIGDVTQAIDYARDVDDEGLWEDLLTYSMDKPVFVQGLLMQGGSVSETLSSEELVRRIPNGLVIPGLKEGLTAVIKDAEIQDSIAEGAARVSRAEVALRLEGLIRRRNRGVVFDLEQASDAADAVTTTVASATLRRQPSDETVKQHVRRQGQQCSACTESLLPAETSDEGDAAPAESLLAYECGHVFHLNCVLDHIASPDNIDAIERLQRLLEEQEYPEADGSAGHPTSAKIARAQRIATVLGSRGCMICDGDDLGDTLEGP